MEDTTVPPMVEPASEPIVPPAAEAPVPPMPAAPPLTPIAAVAPASSPRTGGTEEGALKPADDTERALAAVAHIFGWISAAIVMILAQHRSAYLRFHALQALAFDLVLFAVNFVVSFLVGGLFFLIWFGMITSLVASRSGTGPGSPPPPELALMFFIFPLFGLCMGGYNLGILVVRIVAAVRGFGGHVYAYPLIERWLKP